MLLALALVVGSSGYQGQTAASHVGADGICLKLEPATKRTAAVSTTPWAD